MKFKHINPSSMIYLLWIVFCVTALSIYVGISIYLYTMDNIDYDNYQSEKVAELIEWWETSAIHYEDFLIAVGKKYDRRMVSAVIRKVNPRKIIGRKELYEEALKYLP